MYASLPYNSWFSDFSQYLKNYITDFITLGFIVWAVRVSDLILNVGLCDLYFMVHVKFMKFQGTYDICNDHECKILFTTCPFKKGFYRSQLNIISTRKGIADTNSVNHVTCSRQSGITHVVTRRYPLHTSDVY